MKMKSKIMMAVLAMIFLAAGSAFANSIDVTYTVSGSSGAYTFDFTLTRNIADQNIYFFGVDKGTPASAPAGWNVWNGGAIWSNAAKGGSDIQYTANWLIKPVNASNVTLSFIDSDSELPPIIHYFVYTVGTGIYDGSENFYAEKKTCGIIYGFEGTAIDPPAAVPEPATMFLIGLGLLGMAGLRRKLDKK